MVVTGAFNHGPDVHHTLFLLEGSSTASSLDRRLRAVRLAAPPHRLTVSWVSAGEMQNININGGSVQADSVPEVLLETVVAGEIGAVLQETDAFVIAEHFLEAPIERLEGPRGRYRNSHQVTIAPAGVSWRHFPDWAEAGRLVLLVGLALFGAGFTAGLYTPGILTLPAQRGDVVERDRQYGMMEELSRRIDQLNKRIDKSEDDRKY
jgi:hypothetical protein